MSARVGVRRDETRKTKPRRETSERAPYCREAAGQRAFDPRVRSAGHAHAVDLTGGDGVDPFDFGGALAPFGGLPIFAACSGRSGREPARRGGRAGAVGGGAGMKCQRDAKAFVARERIRGGRESTLEDAARPRVVHERLRATSSGPAGTGGPRRRRRGRSDRGRGAASPRWSPRGSRGERTFVRRSIVEKKSAKAPLSNIPVRGRPSVRDASAYRRARRARCVAVVARKRTTALGESTRARCECGSRTPETVGCSHRSSPRRRGRPRDDRPRRAPVRTNNDNGRVATPELLTTIDGARFFPPQFRQERGAILARGRPHPAPRDARRAHVRALRTRDGRLVVRTSDLSADPDRSADPSPRPSRAPPRAHSPILVRSRVSRLRLESMAKPPASEASEESVPEDVDAFYVRHREAKSGRTSRFYLTRGRDGAEVLGALGEEGAYRNAANFTNHGALAASDRREVQEWLDGIVAEGIARQSVEGGVTASPPANPDRSGAMDPAAAEPPAADDATTFHPENPSRDHQIHPSGTSPADPSAALSFYADYAQEKFSHADGRRGVRFFLIDHTGASHPAVIGEERDVRDGHYAYRVEPRFEAGMPPLPSANLVGVHRWLRDACGGRVGPNAAKQGALGGGGFGGHALIGGAVKIGGAPGGAGLGGSSSRGGGDAAHHRAGGVAGPGASFVSGSGTGRRVELDPLGAAHAKRRRDATYFQSDHFGCEDEPPTSVLTAERRELRWAAARRAALAYVREAVHPHTAAEVERVERSLDENAEASEGAAASSGAGTKKQRERAHAALAKVLDALRQLGSQYVNLEVLRRTEVRAKVSRLRRHPDPTVAAMATRLVDGWLATLRMSVGVLAAEYDRPPPPKPPSAANASRNRAPGPRARRRRREGRRKDPEATGAPSRREHCRARVRRAGRADAPGRARRATERARARRAGGGARGARGGGGERAATTRGEAGTRRAAQGGEAQGREGREGRGESRVKTRRLLAGRRYERRRLGEQAPRRRRRRGRRAVSGHARSLRRDRPPRRVDRRAPVLRRRQKTHPDVHPAPPGDAARQGAEALHGVPRRRRVADPRVPALQRDAAFQAEQARRRGRRGRRRRRAGRRARRPPRGKPGRERRRRVRRRGVLARVSRGGGGGGSERGASGVAKDVGIFNRAPGPVRVVQDVAASARDGGSFGGGGARVRRGAGAGRERQGGAQGLRAENRGAEAAPGRGGEAQGEKAGDGAHGGGDQDVREARLVDTNTKALVEGGRRDVFFTTYWYTIITRGLVSSRGSRGV